MTSKNLEHTNNSQFMLYSGKNQPVASRIHG